MKNTLIKIVLTSSLILSGQAQADQQTITAIENASMTLNLSELVTIKNNSHGYDKALANYRLGLNYSFVQQQDKAIDALELATEQLNALVEVDSQDNESWALLAQVYGLRIAYQPMRGGELGPKSVMALSKAQSISPNNPRVLLIKGVSKYNTPAMFGGSKHQALIELSNAIEQYSNDQHSEFHWGFAEAYTWRGLTQLELGNKDAALADWAKAIEISPNHGWAKNLLKKNS
jgi:tetratricopeptide (TPR) repeat protein